MVIGIFLPRRDFLVRRECKSFRAKGRMTSPWELRSSFCTTRGIVKVVRFFQTAFVSSKIEFVVFFRGPTMEQQISMSLRRYYPSSSFSEGSYFHNTNNYNNDTTTNSIMNHRPPSAGALFECVANHDYDGLLHILAAEGVRVLQHQCTWEGM